MSMAKRVRSKLLIRIPLALAALAVFGFLFMRSIRDARSEPYTVEEADLRNWTLVLAPASGPTDPLLVLRPPARLSAGLFRQVFSRTMESLNSPSEPAVPLVLKGEFDRAFGGRATPDVLLSAARSAGLESVPFKPRCLAVRRVSEPGETRQVYFVVFDAPAFAPFRETMRKLAADNSGSGGFFDPAELSAVLFVGATDSGFSRWLPLRADAESDCVAPIVAS
jgi:hypothetical protein